MATLRKPPAGQAYWPRRRGRPHVHWFVIAEMVRQKIAEGMTATQAVNQVAQDRRAAALAAGRNRSGEEANARYVWRALAKARAHERGELTLKGTIPAAFQRYPDLPNLACAARSGLATCDLSPPDIASIVDRR